ncbi:hypothetical protein ACLB1Q_07420 [Escherichia coli]
MWFVFGENRYRCASDCGDCRHYCHVAQRNKRQRGELRVNNLSEQYKEMKEELAAALMDYISKNSGTKRRRKSISKKRKQQKRKPNWERWQLTVNPASGCWILRQHGRP